MKRGRAFLFTFMLAIHAPVSSALAQADPFWAGDDDARWYKFVQGPCALIKNVPIVARSPGVSTSDAILSSILGYYEQQLPILGLPVPKRVQSLVSVTVSTQKDMDETGRDALSRFLYELEATASRKFREFARMNPNETDGAVRSYFLRTLGGAGVEETLRKIASERFQTVKVERFTTLSFATVKNAVRAQKPAVLSVRGGQITYAVIGYFDPENLAIVIDSDSARPIQVPAERVLLTEQDRKSTGKFASRAREVLKGQTFLDDDRTSCGVGRPAGLRFLNPNKLREGTELYVVHTWGLDTPRVLGIIRK